MTSSNSIGDGLDWRSVSICEIQFDSFISRLYDAKASKLLKVRSEKVVCNTNINSAMIGMQ